MYLSEHFGRAFWVDDKNEFRSCPLFVNNKPDFHKQIMYQSGQIGRELDYEKLFNIHHLEILNSEKFKE